MPTFIRRTPVGVSAAALFAWHERPGAFDRLVAPFQPVHLEAFEGIRDGQHAVIRLPLGPLTIRWVARHRHYQPGRQFEDVQVKGPFAQWEHTHKMIPDGETRSVLEDHIRYKLPFNLLSSPVAGWASQGQLNRLFAYRHRVTKHDLEAHSRSGLPPQTFAVTGATGLIGQALCAFLTTGGHAVVRLVRTPEDVKRYHRSPMERAVYWDPARGHLDPRALAGLDGVIHLAGEPVFGLRWTPEKKRRILESRVDGTALLARTLAQLARTGDGPKVFLSASASGYYGDRDDRPVTEDSLAGGGFLADVCRRWEEAARPAEQAGIRTHALRIGLVLSPMGGLLRVLTPFFKTGLGGWIGDGGPFLPWIALDDVLYALLHLLATDAPGGPVNLSAPQPVTNRVFAKTLGDTLGRPVFVQAPERLMERINDEFVRETILKSTRMMPQRLLEDGFLFTYPTLDDALGHVLGTALDLAQPDHAG